MRELLKANIKKHELVWPFLRDNLHLCHVLISRTAFTITLMLPLVNALSTFFVAPRRIYMSATIADDSEIIRTFDAGGDAVSKALTSRSLAGIGERMILIPELMPFQFDIRAAIKKILETIAKSKRGAVVLVSSSKPPRCIDSCIPAERVVRLPLAMWLVVDEALGRRRGFRAAPSVMEFDELTWFEAGPCFRRQRATGRSIYFARPLLTCELSGLHSYARSGAVRAQFGT